MRCKVLILWVACGIVACHWEVAEPSEPDGFGSSSMMRLDSGIVAPLSALCSPQTPNGRCPAEQVCVQGACCAQEQACPNVCCASSARCIMDAAGNRACATRCQTNRDCGGDCCSLLADSSHPGQIASEGVCLAGQTQCRCEIGSDCASGFCAPRVDAFGNPAIPYICTQNTCKSYQRCSATWQDCPAGYCNICDMQKNCFCARSCTNDTMCGGARCAVLGTSITSQCPSSPLVCTPRI